MAYTTMPEDNETIANLPGDIRAVTTMATNLISSHTGAAAAAHAASAISHGTGNVETALNAAAGHAANQNNPHGVTVEQIGALAVGDAVATITANKVVRRDAAGKIAGDITGNAMTATTATTAINGIPAGVIAMWSGSSAAIPSGWALCNGQNGTPNLVDRFIVGAGNSYAVGATGGEATHTLTVNEMPSHTHNYTDVCVSPDKGGTGYPGARKDCWESWPYTQTSNATGGGQAHENRPPYYALCYIMKL